LIPVCVFVRFIFICVYYVFIYYLFLLVCIFYLHFYFYVFVLLCSFLYYACVMFYFDFYVLLFYGMLITGDYNDNDDSDNDDNDNDKDRFGDKSDVELIMLVDDCYLQTDDITLSLMDASGEWVTIRHPWNDRGDEASVIIRKRSVETIGILTSVRGGPWLVAKKTTRRSSTSFIGRHCLRAHDAHSRRTSPKRTKQCK